MDVTATIFGESEGAAKGNARLVDATIKLNLKQIVREMELCEAQELVSLLGQTLAASDFLDAFNDPDHPGIEETQRLTDRGIIILDMFVERAVKLKRIPDDYEPDWVGDLRGSVDRLQRLIVEARVDDALDLLREIVPDQDFLSPAAEKMLASIHQGALAL